MNEQALTVKQVAERLQVSAGQVYTLIHSGQLSGRRIGKGVASIRVLPADLEAFLEASLIRPVNLRPAEAPPKKRLRPWKYFP